MGLVDDLKAAEAEARGRDEFQYSRLLVDIGAESSSRKTAPMLKLLGRLGLTSADVARDLERLAELRRRRANCDRLLELEREAVTAALRVEELQRVEAEAKDAYDRARVEATRAFGVSRSKSGQASDISRSHIGRVAELAREADGDAWRAAQETYLELRRKMGKARKGDDADLLAELEEELGEAATARERCYHSLLAAPLRFYREPVPEPPTFRNIPAEPVVVHYAEPPASARRTGIGEPSPVVAQNTNGKLEGASRAVSFVGPR
jgi:hypothetical protein